MIRNQHVAPVTNVNFSISIGTRVPRDVGVPSAADGSHHDYPEWRGYEFILVSDQIVVIDPQHLRDRGRPRRLILPATTLGGGPKARPFLSSDIRDTRPGPFAAQPFLNIG